MSRKTIVVLVVLIGSCFIHGTKVSYAQQSCQATTTVDAAPCGAVDAGVILANMVWNPSVTPRLLSGPDQSWEFEAYRAVTTVVNGQVVMVADAYNNGFNLSCGQSAQRSGPHVGFIAQAGRTYHTVAHVGARPAGGNFSEIGLKECDIVVNP